MIQLTLSGRKKILFLASLIGIILILSIIVLSFNFYEKRLTAKNKALAKEIDYLAVKIENFTTPEDKNNAEYALVKQYLAQSSTAKTPKEKYDTLKTATSRLQLLYTLTNNNDLYKIINIDIANVAKASYPDLYEESAFLYPCQDPKCSELPQPPEILAIVEEIKASDILQDYKEIHTRSLLNAGYRPKSDKEGRVFFYLNAANSMSINPDISSSGANLKIADKIRQYVKTAYPKEYELQTQAEK